MKKPLRIQSLFVIYSVICLIFGNIASLLAIILVITLHEAGHMAFVLLFKGRILSFELSLLGGKIALKTPNFNFLQELLVNVGRPD